MGMKSLKHLNHIYLMVVFILLQFQWPLARFKGFQSRPSEQWIIDQFSGFMYEQSTLSLVIAEVSKRLWVRTHLGLSWPSRDPLNEMSTIKIAS